MSAATGCAGTFHKLHHQPELLILANAWDAGSAPLIESLGARRRSPQRAPASPGPAAIRTERRSHRTFWSQALRRSPRLSRFRFPLMLKVVMRRIPKPWAMSSLA